jgi:hypothetical protein
MEMWPGNAPLATGSLNGDGISFIAIGLSSLRSARPAGEASGLPKLEFTGVVQGKEMLLRLRWDNLMLYGTSPGVAEMAMKARKSD